MAPDPEPLDPMVLRAQARVGSTLREKWRLDRVLGVGGMAAVYEATHRNGKRAAVKVLHTELSIDVGVRQRFLREGYVANKVGHAGAVSVLDDDTAEDGSVFLVMDLLEGETVDSRWRRKGGRLDAVEVLSVADQLLDVLAAAHEKAIIHRDVKPENLFLNRAGEIKVLDFGIARLRDGSGGISATRTGTTMGTPAYMAPEQARGISSEIDQRTDLWAVGATMFALLTGRLVHEGRTTNEQLVFAITQAAPPLSTIAPDVPAPVAHVVDRALAYEKAARWSDARSMQEAIRLAYETMQGAPLSTAPRLAVPDVALALTQHSPRMAGAAGTTAQPVSAGQSSAGAVDAPVNWRAVVAGGGAALTILVAVAATFVIRSRSPAEPPVAAAITAPTALAGAAPSTSGASSVPLASVSSAPPLSALNSPPVAVQEKPAKTTSTGSGGRVEGGGVARKPTNVVPAPAAAPTVDPRERRR